MEPHTDTAYTELALTSGRCAYGTSQRYSLYWIGTDVMKVFLWHLTQLQPTLNWHWRQEGVFMAPHTDTAYTDLALTSGRCAYGTSHRYSLHWIGTDVSKVCLWHLTQLQPILNWHWRQEGVLMAPHTDTAYTELALTSGRCAYDTSHRYSLQWIGTDVSKVCLWHLTQIQPTLNWHWRQEDVLMAPHTDTAYTELALTSVRCAYGTSHRYSLQWIGTDVSKVCLWHLTQIQPTLTWHWRQ